MTITGDLLEGADGALFETDNSRTLNPKVVIRCSFPSVALAEKAPARDLRGESLSCPRVGDIRPMVTL